MKTCPTCNNTKEDFEFGRQKSSRTGFRSQCKECVRAYNKRYASTSAGKRKKHDCDLARYLRTRDQERVRARQYYQDHKDEIKARSAQRRKVKPEECRVAVERWHKVNKKRSLAIKRKYQLSKRRAMPEWANVEAINKIYENCPTGYHVDHIIPLQGKDVSGLHVEYNLQYLPALENIRKGNRYADR